MLIRANWDNAKHRKQSVSFVKNYFKNKEVKRFFINDKQVKNFKIAFEEDNFVIYYSLKGNNLKYYCSLLNRSFLFYDDFVKALWDKDWENFDEGILKTFENEK